MRIKKYKENDKSLESKGSYIEQIELKKKLEALKEYKQL